MAATSYEKLVYANDRQMYDDFLTDEKGKKGKKSY